MDRARCTQDGVERPLRPQSRARLVWIGFTLSAYALLAGVLFLLTGLLWPHAQAPAPVSGQTGRGTALIGLVATLLGLPFCAWALIRHVSSGRTGLRRGLPVGRSLLVAGGGALAATAVLLQAGIVAIDLWATATILALGGVVLIATLLTWPVIRRLG